MIAPKRLHSGVTVDLAHPDPRLINLGDLAFALAGIYRWTGTSRYTVAQHCVHVHELDGRPWALLHDAEEAFVGDVCKGLKKLLGPKYRNLARGWSLAIAERFGVKIVDVKESDDYSADCEAYTLWGTGPSYPKITPWLPRDAQNAWLSTAREIGLR